MDSANGRQAHEKTAGRAERKKRLSKMKRNDQGRQPSARRLLSTRYQPLGSSSRLLQASREKLSILMMRDIDTMCMGYSHHQSSEVLTS
jgi:hypothetical protein